MTQAAWSSDRIHALLKFRHSTDLYVPECKNGPTQSVRAGVLGVLDAWVLVRTWSPITAIGYEIKVSRSDWIRDQKIAGYFENCHLFYVVAPKGVVAVSELPAEAGLLEVSDKRLLTKKKAPRRDITLPEGLLVYVLMARVEPKPEYKERTRAERIHDWREWLDHRNAAKTLGYQVKGKIAELYRAMQEKVEEVDRKTTIYSSVKARIQEFGFDPEQPRSSWEIEQRIRDVVNSVSPRVLGEIERTTQMLIELKTTLVRERQRFEEQVATPERDFKVLQGGGE